MPKQAERRGAPWSPVTLTAKALPEGVLVMRSPAVGDGPAWSAARLANRSWLEKAFPAWGSDWAAEQSETAWAQRCLRLRRMALRGRAAPFVITLDGELIGELGIDAIDETSGSGEASVWMVRSHGSAAVMGTASLLLIEHVFTGRNPVDRIVSPVATTSRRGRAPGLSAVGFEIEATVPRRSGTAGLVDHDIWILHNTATNRRKVSAALADVPDAAPRSTAPRSTARPVTVATSAARALLREAKSGLQGMSPSAAARPAIDSSAGSSVDSGVVSVALRTATRADLALLVAPRALRLAATRWAIDHDDRVAVVLGHSTDVGTATTEVFMAIAPGTPRDVTLAAVRRGLDELRPGADEPRVLVVRVATGAVPGTVPDDDLLAEIGLDRIAQYRASHEARRNWSGEDLWRVPAVR